MSDSESDHSEDENSDGSDRMEGSRSPSPLQCRRSADDPSLRDDDYTRCGENACEEVGGAAAVRASRARRGAIDTPSAPHVAPSSDVPQGCGEERMGDDDDQIGANREERMGDDDDQIGENREERMGDDDDQIEEDEEDEDGEQDDHEEDEGECDEQDGGSKSAAAAPSRGRPKERTMCWLCTFSSTPMAVEMLDFISQGIHTMDILFLASQVRRAILESYPYAKGVRKRDIARHIRTHMLDGNVKMACNIHSLSSLAETLRQSMHQVDPNTEEVLVDVKVSELYLKVLAQMASIYRTVDAKKMLFTR